MKIMRTPAVALLAGLVACGGSRSGDGGAPPTPPATPTLTVFAGVPSGLGSRDGTGSAARFNYPRGIAVDGTGNVYVADSGNHTIRKITPSGVVTTLAGTAGSWGSADGTGVAARFNTPGAIAVDGTGNVYVADTYNHTIRQITPSGVVTTFAGTAGSMGSADGASAAAQFNFPSGVAVDGAGYVYVADANNHTIRKISPAGVVTTLAGMAGSVGAADGTGSAALFNTPRGLSVDGSGSVYVADTGNSTIRKVTPAGVVTTLAGTAGSRGSADGTGTSAQFWNPWGVSTDGTGNVFVADSWSQTIRRITPAGAVTTLAGTAGSYGSVDGTAGAARFAYPLGVAVDGTGTAHVVDYGNSTIRNITPAGVVTTLAGTASSVGSADGTGAAASFNGPFGLAVDGSGSIYVADTRNETIRKVTPAGVVTTLAGTAGSSGSADGTGAAAQFLYPEGVAVDGSGAVYVADRGNFTIRKITPAGVVTTLAGTVGSSGNADGTGAAAQFNSPCGIAVDGGGNVYVADTGNHAIRKITPAGMVTTFAGTAGSRGWADGTGATAGFSSPGGVAVDGGGNVYVADTRNQTIRRITPGGVVTTLAGTAALSGSADGNGASARFNFPEGLAVDGIGNVYVADTINHTIRKITPAGVVSTLIGEPGVGGIVTGPLPAFLWMPSAVALDPTSGDLFITVPDAVLKVTF
jgi:hypothetical protein